MTLEELKALRDGITPGNYRVVGEKDRSTIIGMWHLAQDLPMSGNLLGYVDTEGTAKAVAALPALLDQCIRYREALENIDNPIAAMQRMAEDEGCRLDGRMIVSLSNDPSFYKEIARQALMVEDREQ